ncbi:MAG: exodeoxyribonuclease V subunit beta [Thermodesulfobacteriota bacterium]
MEKPAFDVTRAPLAGVHLVEASAGTGKTFQLSTLYVRLVAEALVPVDRILVVTFTRAATQELSERIRARLAQALDAVCGGSSEDESLAAIAARAGEKGRAALTQALCRFDEACIFTIHGFCQRVLSENAFESQVSFDAELCGDVTDLLREICEDFHRKNVSELPREFLQQAGDLTPAALMKIASFCERHPDMALQAPESMPGFTSLARVRELFPDLCRTWPEARSELSRLLLSPSLQDGTYGRIKEKDGKPPERDERVAGFIAEMDAFLSGGEAWPRPGCLKYFSSRFVSEKTYKKLSAPAHPFFDLCQSFSDASQETLRDFDIARRRLLADAFLYARQELSARKEEKNVLAYSDLIEKLARGLSGPGAPALARAVSARYDAALIDEFQDTDPLQYRIFSTLFGTEEKALFLIGDPKQAIYGFRGADLFSYLQAAREAGSIYTLTRNWRSGPELVNAVNEIFGRARLPFVLPGIGFTRGEAADRPRDELTVEGEKLSGLVLWAPEPPEGGKDKPAGKLAVGRNAVRAVTAEIARLMALGARGRAKVGEENLCAGHVAVLVRTNRQAIQVKDSLSAAGIPAVLHTSQSLFSTPEAGDLLFLLTAAGNPQDLRAVRSALAVPLLRKSISRLCLSLTDEAEFERLAAAFRGFRVSWTQRGFFFMFAEMLSFFSLAPRLLSEPGGERPLANLFQLAEFLATAEHQQTLSPSGLCDLLAQRIADPAAEADEEHVLRLESDEEAVQVMTVHRSKGLEYPVVFAPFVHDPAGPASDKADIVFHDPENENRMTLCLLSDPGRGKELYETEVLAENVRLFYVAATRARHLGHMVWGRINKCEGSAPAYLLHQPETASSSMPPHRLLQETAERYENLSPEELEQDLSGLAHAARGAVRIEPLEEDRAIPPVPPPAAPPEIACRSFLADPDQSFGLTSFSGLASSSEDNRPGTDEGGPLLFFSPRLSAKAPDGSGSPDPFAFPRGPEAGTAIHEVLEKCDYQHPDAPELPDLCARVLEARGIAPRWAGALARMVQNVLTTPLIKGKPGSMLCRVPPADRIHEMEFSLPVRTLTPPLLSRPFRSSPKPSLQTLADHAGRLDFAPVSGFIRGFVDLVFVLEGRTYIVDFKSNHLGDRISDYGPENMALAMDQHLYGLQYHIYCLAASTALAGRDPGFDYDRDFGGVLYLFTRGMSPENGPETGVFADRPDKDLLSRLADSWMAPPEFGQTIL